MNDILLELKRVSRCVFKDGWESPDLHSRAGIEISMLRARLAELQASPPAPSSLGIDWENPECPAVKLFVGFDVEGYVEEYELCGEDGDYSPNEQERVLLVDAIYGVVSNLHEGLRKIIPSSSAHEVLSVTPSIEESLRIQLASLRRERDALEMIISARGTAPAPSLMGDIERCAQIAHAVYEAEIDRRDACLSEGPPNCEGALTRARQAQTAEEIEKQIRALIVAPSADLRGLIREAADIIQDERDCIAQSHTIDGALMIEEDIDQLAGDALAQMDDWLIRAKAALCPVAASEGSADD